MSTRRAFLRLAAAGPLGLAAALLSGHAPYRQWKVYRANRLMIVAGKFDPPAFAVVEALVAHLKRALPDEARPTPARAPTLRHIASLVATRQIDLAVMTEAEARMVQQGTGRSTRPGPVPLRVLAFLREPYVLVCNPAFGPDRGYLVTFGVFDEGGAPVLDGAPRELVPAVQRAQSLGIRLHPGARDFFVEDANRRPGARSSPADGAR